MSISFRISQRFTVSPAGVRYLKTPVVPRAISNLMRKEEESYKSHFSKKELTGSDSRITSHSHQKFLDATRSP